MTAEFGSAPGSVDVARAIDDLHGDYAMALDWHDWQKWLSLFLPDCYYAVFSRQYSDQGLPLGYMIDDCHARIVDRVKFITEVWAGTIEPYNMRHAIQRVSMQEVGEDLFEVISNIIVTYTENDDPSKLLATGYYKDIVRVNAQGARFSSKTVYIDGTPARYLAYPL